MSCCNLQFPLPLLPLCLTHLTLSLSLPHSPHPLSLPASLTSPSLPPCLTHLTPLSLPHSPHPLSLPASPHSPHPLSLPASLPPSLSPFPSLSDLSLQQKLSECSVLVPGLLDNVPHVLATLGRDGVVWGRKEGGRYAMSHFSTMGHPIHNQPVSVSGAGDR